MLSKSICLSPFFEIWNASAAVCTAFIQLTCFLCVDCVLAPILYFIVRIPIMCFCVYCVYILVHLGVLVSGMPNRALLCLGTKKILHNFLIYVMNCYITHT